MTPLRQALPGRSRRQWHHAFRGQATPAAAVSLPRTLAVTKSMPANAPTEYLFPVQAAARLASLTGLQADLEMVVGYCDRMIERYAGKHLAKTPFDIVGFTTPVDFMEWEALSTAACVAYARCFLSGVRQSLDAEELNATDPTLRTGHEFVVALRNKHVAHSVNAFEQNSVTVSVGADCVSSAEIEAVTPRHQRQTGLSFDFPAKLKILAEWWLRRVSEEVSRERELVLQVARGTPLAEIRAYGTLKSTSSNDRNAAVGKRRRHP